MYMIVVSLIREFFLPKLPREGWFCVEYIFSHTVRRKVLLLTPLQLDTRYSLWGTNYLDLVQGGVRGSKRVI